MHRRNKVFKKKRNTRPRPKRTQPRKNRGTPQGITQAGSRQSFSALEVNIISLLRNKPQFFSLQDLLNELNLNHTQVKAIKDILARLCHRQILKCTKKKHYQFNQDAGLVQATVSMHPRGFGFAVIEVKDDKKENSRRSDPYISRSNLGTANHGDRVLVELFGHRKNRMEARVLQVLSRAVSRLAGIFSGGRDTGTVMPEDERFTYTIMVHKENFCGARSGNAVIVEITDFIPGQRNPTGRIIQVLGDPEDLEVQTKMVISKYSLPDIFENNSLQQANSLPEKVKPDKARTDLRKIVHFTIDGDDARDFDDAVAIAMTPKGYRLYVSIADVSHYVEPNSPLDNEACRRGTSVYFPTMVVPMLPERLSNNLCSLVPNQDRYAFTVVLDFDNLGKPTSKEFFKSIIKSHYRLTYIQVKDILAGKDAQLKKKYGALEKPLHFMADLSKKLEHNRLTRGSIGFSLPEANLTIDDQGQIQEITRTKRYLSHKIIEEFMLAANEAVAETLAEQNIEVLYRIHEVPDPVKVADFTTFAKTLGLKLPDGQGTPQWFGNILDLVAETPKEYIVNNLLLRTMKRARYSPENTGHFGLAATHYTHFTSPIRRYPDLLVHRKLAELLEQRSDGVPIKSNKRPEPFGSMTTAGDFLSEREKIATEAEWEMIDRLKVRFMKDKVGEVYDGVIASITPYGIFVELLEWFISGAIPLKALADDYYSLDERNHRLVGSHTGRIFQLGDLLQVRVENVQVHQRRIDFILAEKEKIKKDKRV